MILQLSYSEGNKKMPSAQILFVNSLSITIPYEPSPKPGTCTTGIQLSPHEYSYNKIIGNWRNFALKQYFPFTRVFTTSAIINEDIYKKYGKPSL